jgi:hypothetical protein
MSPVWWDWCSWDVTCVVRLMFMTWLRAERRWNNQGRADLTSCSGARVVNCRQQAEVGSEQHVNWIIAHRRCPFKKSTKAADNRPSTFDGPRCRRKLVHLISATAKMKRKLSQTLRSRRSIWLATNAVKSRSRISRAQFDVWSSTE